MKYLLDTHVLLWYLFEDEKLSKKATEILTKLDIDIYISAISFWEISVKFNSGKLHLNELVPEDLPERCIDYGFKALPMSTMEAASFYKLSSVYHRDPFDRMLIWQSIQNNLVLITNDGNMSLYKADGLKLLW